MHPRIDARTLLVIPCCKEKDEAGQVDDGAIDPLACMISPQCHHDLLSARAKLLSLLKSNPRFSTGKYEINKAVCEGPDFGQADKAGTYLPAVARYKGNLYSVSSAFTSTIRQVVQLDSTPRILILSALYGPLHPLSCIQNYDLQMKDSPANRVWKAVFPLFLKEYVTRNEIRAVRLYLGRTTAYLKIAEAALRPLVKSGLVDAMHYDVEDGSSRETPRNHGLQLLSDLGCPARAVLSRRVVANQITA